MAYVVIDDRGSAASLSARNTATRVTRESVTRQIGIVLFEGFSLLGAGMVAEVFQLANDIAMSEGARTLPYRVWLLSVEGGAVACSSSLKLATSAIDEVGDSCIRGFDALFIGGGRAVANALGDARLKAWLHRVVPASDEVRAIGEGHQLLKAAGLESEQGGAPFGQRVRLAGPEDDATADDHHEALRAALVLIRRDMGADAARKVGERALPSLSTRLSALFADASRPTSGDKVWASARWLQENCERAISVADAAQAFAMSERNFLRRFKDVLGMTPSDYLLQVRLELTCQLLVNTDLPVDKIARRSGMRDGDRLSKVFRSRLGVSPTEYRSRHRVRVDDAIGQ
ncbi:helix-turn-helix domain-containing protein [Burkholderia sp. Ax-1719]|jgi:transcriptional regulator GlxA family with amidase domain|nr:helix-turn-helix domain-containing protein [Burkholderia sp. Ax-1719]NIE68181.1 helix-turn-helix domain-containing protein [Burkholderia sp. Ax-1719]